MAFTRVKKTTAVGSTTSSPTTATFSGGNTAGNLIVVCVAAMSTGGNNPVTSITDTIGNTYTLVATANAGSFAGGTHMYYIANPCLGTGSNNVISVAWTVGTQTRLSVYGVEYSGQAVSAFDKSAVTNTSGSSVSYSITPTNSAGGELLISMNVRTSGGPNWSGLSGTDLSGATAAQLEVMDVLSSATGTNTVTATSSSTFFGSSTAAFFPATGFNRALLGVGL